MASSPKSDDQVLVDTFEESVVQSAQEAAQYDGPPDAAPRYSVPSRILSAVEIPAVVENIDRAVMAFGRVPSLTHVLDPLRSSLPLFLNPESPFCPPIMSHNAKSHNVVLKVTVPKRTGRKRRRGTHGPWQGDIEFLDSSAGASIPSLSATDKLADNVGKYQVEAVGIIKNTHRFRGLADFHWDMSRSSFAQRYTNQVLPGEVQQMKAFNFAPGIDHGPNVVIIPPPLFTHMSLPFNYNYSQNPYVRTTEDGGTINTTAVRQVGYFISAEEPAPTGPQFPPNFADPRTMEIIAQLEEAFRDRPVWTRRSLLNHMGDRLRNWNELKKYLNYTAYQFKGGPWRDGVVPYGVDPRTDASFRIYQTLMFKMTRRGHRDRTWQSIRRSRNNVNKDYYGQDNLQSHIFDGESYHTDGKVWQVCDITDPLLREILDNAAVRPTWDVNSGWYHGGLWAKVKAIMKTKLVAIQFGRHLTRDDFRPTLNCGDRTPTRGPSSTFHLPLPDLGLTKEELVQLRGREPPKKKSSGYNVRVREPKKMTEFAGGWEPGVGAQSNEVGEEGAGSGDDDDSAGGGEYDDEDTENEEDAERPAYSDGDEQDDDDDGGEEEDGAMGGTVYPELD